MPTAFKRLAARDRVVRLATAYDDASEDEEVVEDATTETEEFVIPEDFSDLNDEQLTELHQEAIGHFDSVYGDGSGLSDEDLETLAQLTDGIETIQTEVAARETAETERQERAAELASRARPGAELNADTEDEDGGDGDDEEDDDEDAEEDDESEAPEDEEDAEDESAAETVTASGRQKKAARKPIRLPMNSVRRHKGSSFSKKPAQGVKDVMFDTEGNGVNWHELAESLDRQLASFNVNQYSMAAKRGQPIREQRNLAVFKKPTKDDLTITSGDIAHIDTVLNRAVDQSSLKGGSLVAAGGWGAPSETLYDFLELESRDGLLSVPEVNIARGGINFTKGPKFQDIFDNTGFDFTEADDIAGTYSDEEGEFAGNKPSYRIEMPDFEEKRMDVVGLSITAGILQARGYPEVLDRVIRGALIAHDHKYTAETIARIIQESDAVTMPAPQVGAVAPVLNSIELQMEHYRYLQRMSWNSPLEAVFPRWILPALRSDLARQRGVDTKAITDAQITGWFTARNAAVQFVYNWQNLTGDAGQFTQWPTEVQFLLYAAGTWVRGTSDIITMDSIYDSVNLAQNDFIALFTEEGLLMAKRGHDSRVVTVPIETSGTAAGRMLINHDGTPVTADEAPAA